MIRGGVGGAERRRTTSGIEQGGRHAVEALALLLAPTLAVEEAPEEALVQPYRTWAVKIGLNFKTIGTIKVEN